MNERMLELYRQAQVPDTAIDPSNNMPYETTRFSADKFAELIVRACANAADMAQDAGCEYAGDYVAEYMGYGEQEGVTEWRAK
jgi:hypothetical protein